MADSVARFVELLRAAERVLAFTGAGISTNSNLPDFRGPKGLFRSSSPVYFDEFLRSETSRKEYWKFKLEGYRAFEDARPNPAHEALVHLEKLGKLECIVTQNVDGLHRLAGTTAERLIELHGTNSEVECIDCSKRELPARAFAEFAATGEPPRCVECGGLMKPAVVMFGQALDPIELTRARRASESADLVLALGSSLVVTPAADIPLYGARRGAPYVIINQGETPQDRLATLCIDDDLGRVLMAAVAAI
jgi:NAD-dependent deacetylase